MREAMQKAYRYKANNRDKQWYKKYLKKPFQENPTSKAHLMYY